MAQSKSKCIDCYEKNGSLKVSQAQKKIKYITVTKVEKKSKLLFQIRSHFELDRQYDSNNFLKGLAMSILREYQA